MTRILLAELCEPHDVAIAVARTLRDSGEEIVYVGVLHTLDEVLAVAEQEDPQAVVLAADSARAEQLVGAVAEALPRLPVSTIRIDTDVDTWVERGAIYATGCSSQRRR